MQTRLHSFIEACSGTAIGFLLSLLTGCVVYPLYGMPFSLVSNVQITLIFTALSVVRTYVMRRYFNKRTSAK